MKSVNEWVTQYSVVVTKIDDYSNSMHSFNQKVLYAKQVKDVNDNYRFRLGIQCGPLTNNKEYSLVFECIFTDLKLYSRADIRISSNQGIQLHSHNTKFMTYDTTTTMHYSKTLIHFKKIPN